MLSLGVIFRMTVLRSYVVLYGLFSFVFDGQFFEEEFMEGVLAEDEDELGLFVGVREQEVEDF